MPLYPYQCNVCDRKEDFLFGFEHDAPICCGEHMDRTYHETTIGFSIDFKDGYDTGAGKYFVTKRERDTYLSQKQWRRIKS